MTINVQPSFGSPVAMTITLASLASSTANVGRQSALVDNSTLKYDKVLINIKVTLGTGPAANKGVYVWAIRGNGTNRTDGAGASDAALTFKNATPLDVLTTGSAPSSNDVLYKTVIMENPGSEWGIGISQDSGAALNATGGNHVVSYTGIKYEVA